MLEVLRSIVLLMHLNIDIRHEQWTVLDFDVTAGKESRFIGIMRQHLDFFAPDSQLLIMFI